MKQLITLTLILLLAMPALAEDKYDAQKYCTEMSLLAGAIMYSRQTGMSIDEQLDWLDNDAFDQSFKNIVNEMIINAYSKPAYRTQEYQDEAIGEFEDEYYTFCTSIIKDM